MYRWAIEILRADGTRVGQRVIAPSLAPLIESARLEFLRRHGPSAAADYDRPAEIKPIWQEKLGEPYVGALRVQIAGEVAVPAAGTTVFREAAAEVSAEFVKNGALEEGAKFVYLVTAYEAEVVAALDSSTRFRVAPLPAGLRITAGQWPESTSRDENEVDIGIAIPRRILDEISELTKSKRGVETGGALLGHLRWDPIREDIFLDITEQIHAREAIGDATRLRFTSECWADIRARLALRGQDESIVGWWHSHPGRDWCKECPRERQEQCAMQRGFLSSHDETLQRTVFPRAFMPALVATNTAFDRIDFAMFGWRDGVLERRDYQIVESEEGA